MLRSPSGEGRLSLDTYPASVYTDCSGHDPEKGLPRTHLLADRRVQTRQRQTPPHRPAASRQRREVAAAAARISHPTGKGAGHPVRCLGRALADRPRTGGSGPDRCSGAQARPRTVLRAIYAVGGPEPLCGRGQQSISVPVVSTHCPAPATPHGAALAGQSAVLGSHAAARQRCYQRGRATARRTGDRPLPDRFADADLRCHQLRYVHRQPHRQRTGTTRPREEQTC